MYRFGIVIFTILFFSTLGQSEKASFFFGAMGLICAICEISDTWFGEDKNTEEPENDQELEEWEREVNG